MKSLILAVIAIAALVYVFTAMPMQALEASVATALAF
jgi:hypothetical protein